MMKDIANSILKDKNLDINLPKFGQEMMSLYIIGLNQVLKELRLAMLRIISSHSIIIWASTHIIQGMMSYLLSLTYFAK